MMCYRDRTFCAAKECLHFRECPVALTEDVKKAAEEDGLPISQFVDPTKNYCYKPQKAAYESNAAI